MELNLTPAFFWPINSTIVRSFKFKLGLAGQRARYRLLWRIAPGKAIESGARQLLTPPSHRFPDAELRLMEEASLLPVPMRTGRLVGWRWGRARDPVVVLVHGWGGRGTQLRAFIARLLARGLSVVAYDAPGHGMTGGAEANDLAFEEDAIAQAEIVFDVVAIPAETPLIVNGRAQGKRVITGLEVIAIQALEQFVLYTGVRPTPEQFKAAVAFARS